MEIAAVAIKQAMLQSNIGLSMVKQAAQNEQALVNLVAASVDRGQNLDISV